MATTNELLSLHRKIALNSYHQKNKPPRKRPNGFKRQRSHSGADLMTKPSVKLLQSSKNNKFRSKDTTHTTVSHLPSMPKPFKKIFKKPKRDTHDPHLQSRSFSHNPRKKSKSKSKSRTRSKHKNASESNIAKTVNLKKCIDVHLIQQYQQYVENRVEMFRSRAFPNDVIYQLPQYRADLTDSVAQSRLKPYFSRHKECDQLNQAALLKAQEISHQHATKLPNKSSTFKTIKRGIAAPIKPIKHLLQQSMSMKARTPDIPSTYKRSQTHMVQLNDANKEHAIHTEDDTVCDAVLSPNHLELKFNIIPRQRSLSFDENELQMQPESTASVTAEPKNESIEPTPYSLASISQISDVAATQLISALSTKKMPIIVDNENETQHIQKIPEITPTPHQTHGLVVSDHEEEGSTNVPPQLPHAYTLDDDAIKHTRLQMENTDEILKRAATMEPRGRSTQKHRRSRSDPSPTPPYFSTRTSNVRTIKTGALFDRDHLRSTTPSWAYRESSGSDEGSDNGTEMRSKHIANKSNDTVLIHEDCEILESKYNTLETQWHELQMTVRSMQQGMEQQEKRIDLLKQQLHEIQEKLKTTEAMKQLEDIPTVQMTASDDKESKVQKKQKKTRFNMKYFEHNYGKYWDKFKEKILKESDRISFERSKWENLYHSLFCYFMNGLVVIWMLIQFVFGCFVCCEGKSNRNKSSHKKNKPNENHTIKNFSDIQDVELFSSRSHSRLRNLKRKKKRKQIRLRRDKNVWRDRSEEHQYERTSSPEL